VQLSLCQRARDIHFVKKWTEQGGGGTYFVPVFEEGRACKHITGEGRRGSVGSKRGKNGGKPDFS